MKKKHNHSQGFTMIELLVSVILLSVGILGLAGLQATGLQVNQSSYLRSQATVYAYDMLDRMRANMTGVNAGNYNNISGTPADPACITAGCTAAQMALHDTRQWNLDIANTLPTGQGTVVGNGSTFIVTIMWDDERSGTTGTNCGAGDLTCFQVSARL